MFDYQNSAETASKLIAKFGVTRTFTRQADGEYIPGAPPSTTETTYDTKTVWLSYKNDEIDGSSVLMGDAKLLTDPLGNKPEIDDTVQKDGATWRVVDAMPLSPADVNVRYAVQVRK